MLLIWGEKSMLNVIREVWMMWKWGNETVPEKTVHFIGYLTANVIATSFALIFNA